MMLNIIILLISFLISIVISMKLQKKSKSKAMVSIIIINIFITVTYFLIFHFLDEEVRIFGYSQSNKYLVLSLTPVVIWMNFFILSLIKDDNK